DGVFAFRQHDTELSVRWSRLDGRARCGTIWDELDRRIGLSFNERRTGQVANEPEPPCHRVHPYLFVGPGALHRPIRDIVVAAGLHAHWQRADYIAREWRVQGSEVVAFTIHGALRERISANNPLCLMLRQCG